MSKYVALVVRSTGSNAGGAKARNGLSVRSLYKCWDVEWTKLPGDKRYQKREKGTASSLCPDITAAAKNSQSSPVESWWPLSN
mmetsp:Transcript_19768/g.27406  ORF Transcript_19768/g.27406 Transcript_19768/m.27406 type:complete len:83 (-) Transcript_19768:503-751(-)